jgi:hypothetical protein
VGPRRARTRLMSAIAGQACVSARHSQLGSICDRARPTSSNLCSCGHECSKNFSSIETRTRLDSHNDFCQARNVSSDLGNPSYDQAPCLSFHRLCSVASSSLLSNPSYCGLKRHSDAQFQWLSSCAPPDTASASSVSSGRPSACARPHLQRPPTSIPHATIAAAASALRSTILQALAPSPRTKISIFGFIEHHNLLYWAYAVYRTSSARLAYLGYGSCEGWRAHAVIKGCGAG